MKPLKMINFLDSIPKIKNYSHYGNSLEKMFKMSSLKYFIKTLKFKEEFHKKYLKDDSVSKQKEYDIYKMERIQKNKEMDEKDIFSPESNPKPIINPKLKINNKVNKSYFFHKKNFSNLSDSPDALKYNPNYNSISKNIPSYKIVKPSLEKTRNNILKNSLFNSGIKRDISKIIIKDKKNKNFITINNEHKEDSKNNVLNNNDESNESIEKGKRFITEVSIINDKNKRKNFFKNISCKKYPYKLPVITSTIEVPHYMLGIKSNKNRHFIHNLNTISFYNKNKAIDFSKMLRRPTKLFINIHSLKVPNSGYYEPNYNLVEKRQYNIHFNKPVIDKIQRKHNLLKKLMASYNIESNYQLIDNNKLNDDALKKLNL